MMMMMMMIDGLWPCINVILFDMAR